MLVSESVSPGFHVCRISIHTTLYVDSTTRKNAYHTARDPEKKKIVERTEDIIALHLSRVVCLQAS